MNNTLCTRQDSPAVPGTIVPALSSTTSAPALSTAAGAPAHANTSDRRHTSHTNRRLECTANRKVADRQLDINGTLGAVYAEHDHQASKIVAALVTDFGGRLTPPSICVTD